MSEELNVIRKLVGILEPKIIREAESELGNLGFLTEGTNQSLNTLEKARELLLDKKSSKVERLESLLLRMIEQLERVDCSEGYCCCGDPMEMHDNGMMVGHDPVDMGVYHKVKLIEEAQEELNKE